MMDVLGQRVDPFDANPSSRPVVRSCDEAEHMSRPTELAITLATLPHRYSTEGWSCADEVRGRLKLLGFECTAQQVAAWLRRMSRVDAPWIESRVIWGYREYRVTRYGRNDIDNRFPGVSTRIEQVAS